MSWLFRTVSLTALLLLGCSGGGPAAGPGKKTEPAHVAHHVDESDLNTVTLTAAAEQRLGIKTEKVRRVVRPRRRTFGGEVVIPTGQSIVVSAPLAGQLSLPAGAAAPAPGSRVKANQVLFVFRPLLTPERDVLTPAERIRVARTKADVATAQILAAREVESSKVEVRAAQIAFDRARVLLQNKAGSQRTLDEAQARLDLARERQMTAEARNRYLQTIQLDAPSGELATQPIRSPMAGVLQRLDVAPGETVSTGEPLFQVVQLDRLWIRVPLYVGLWKKIDVSAPASVMEFGAAGAASAQPARIISAPPSANPIAATVDLFLDLPNPTGKWQPGQKLAVTLTLDGEQPNRIVPFNAVLYDIHGGAWVYQRTAERTYARRRVAVRYVDDGVAVLAAGPDEGVEVVTTGAVELFGTEFGVGH